MSFNYLPIPPRVWSRVQNQCTYTVDSSYNSTYVPLINKTLPPPEAIFLDKQLYKGNILQYKGNSSRLTKNQKYAQISKGFGPNRTKVFATQGITYTNPNTTSLKRVNSVNIPFPNQIVGSPNNISGPYQYNVPNPNDCSTNYLQDGGNLVCNSYVNPCTGQVIQNVYQQQCFPTYCSDVPGAIIDLCWNPKVQTWFPRNNLTNNNSTSKWPVNYKGLVSAVSPEAPVLLSAVGGCGLVELMWSYVLNICIPISAFNIYQNGKLVKVVPYTITSTAINNLNFNTTYSFYIIALSNTTPSEPSNSLSATTLLLPSSPSNLTANGGCGFVDLSWSPASGLCVLDYNIYYADGTYIGFVPYTNTNYTVQNLNYNASYSFYVTASSNGYNSLPSNIVNVSTFLLDIPNINISSYSATPDLSVQFTLQPIMTNCNTLPYSYNLYYSTGGPPSFINIPGTNNTSQFYTFSPLSADSNYTFYATYVANNGNESANSSTVAVSTIILPPTGLTAVSNSASTINLSWTVPMDLNYILGYNIYNNSTGTLIGSVSGSSTNSYVVTNLLANTPYTFYVKSYNNVSTSAASGTAGTTTLMLYTQIGGSVYSYGSWTGIVFTNSSGNSITFNDSLSVNVLVAGGGGGGGQMTSPFGIGGGGGGGGGGGVYYSSNFAVSNQIYNITVGAGGIGDGKSGGPSAGTSSSVSTSSVSNLILASGGINAAGSSGGSGGYYSYNGGPNINNTANGGYGVILVDGSNVLIPNVSPSTNTYISMPFQPPPFNLYVSGGGGAAGPSQNTSPGGGAGLGNGGLYQASSTPSGVNATYSFTNGGGFGGGGGGTSGYGSPGKEGGNGAQGVVIFWFQN